MDVDLCGRSVPGFSRAEIRIFVRRCTEAIRDARIDLDRFSEVALRFVSDREIASINDTYRGKARATDVLTFPGDSELAPEHLGDIVISIPAASRQAAEIGHDLPTEIRYLILHGLLHALGFDHETDDGEMDALELKLRRKVGLD